MTDLWLNLIWTLLIAAATLVADWIASRFVRMTRGFSALRKFVDQAVGDEIRTSDVRHELDTLSKSAAASLSWGADLVTVAIGLDLATLAIWSNNKHLFPFFGRWNTANVYRDIQIWLVLIFAHLLLLLISIVFKHLHGDGVERLSTNQMNTGFSLKWVFQNKWMLTSNIVGFVSLFSSFAIITDSI